MDPITLEDLKIQIFADGADRASMLDLYRNPLIQGFTTNPTLMRKAGVTEYESFAREILELIPDRPISFEVFSDDFDEMARQASKITTWGDNVFVKIPVTNTSAVSSAPLIRQLSGEGIRLNVTALMTPDQVAEVCEALKDGPPGYISVFAGRVADTGRDPVPIMEQALEEMADYPHLQLIWASPRELLNVFQADAIGCHVITVTPDVLKKLELVGKDLLEFSLATVRMFFEDGREAGFTL